MKNKEIYAGIIFLIAIILAGQAIEPKTQTQPNQQYFEEQNNTTTNTPNTTDVPDTPETNPTIILEIENNTINTDPILPNCTGNYGKLIQTNNKEPYTLWDLRTLSADSIKIISGSSPTYQVYASNKLAGPWLPATEGDKTTTEKSTTAIFILPGFYRYIKIAVNDSNSDQYTIASVEKCIGGGNGTEKEPIKYIDAVESLGKGRGGCGCDDDDPPCTTTTTTSTSTTTTSSTTSTSTTTTSSTSTTESTTTTSTTTSSSTTTTSSTTSTTTSTSTTTTSTTTTSTTTTTIPVAPEFGTLGTPLMVLLIAPAFAYLVVRRKK
jgi:hypothetical protein